jgi:large subunit ribosomal protein L28
MSVECNICGKKPITGHNVSHSHRKTKRRWLPNLQWFTPEGETKRVKVCAKCIKTASKVTK